MHRLLSIFSLLALSSTVQAQSFSEYFDNDTSLPAGWVSVNNSPAGPGSTPDWNVIDSSNFGIPIAAQSGSNVAYANFLSTVGANDISNYLMAPEVTLRNGDTISFWSRTSSNPASWADRLSLVFNTDGSTNPGSFTNTLLTINPDLTTTGYPGVWTEYTATISGLGGPTAGRFAFWYNVPNGGPGGSNSDIVMIDTVTYTSVPAPGALALLGLAGVCRSRRRRN